MGEIRDAEEHARVVDLPGIYSLCALYAGGDRHARLHLINRSRTAVINIVDATNIERNLYLTLQLLELRRAGGAWRST